MISGYSFVSEKVYREIEALQKECNSITDGKQTLALPTEPEEHRFDMFSGAVKTVYVAREKNKAVSAVSAFCDGDKAEITGMTLPEYRKKGYMKRLLPKLVKELRRNGYEDIYLAANALCSEGVAAAEHLGAGYAYSEYMMKVDRQTYESCVESMEELLKTKMQTRGKLSIHKTDAVSEAGEEKDEETEDAEEWDIVGKDDGKEVFTCTIMPFLDGFYIYKVIVKETLRNKGYGTLFMKTVTDMLFSENPDVKAVYLQTGSYNKPAVHVYEKFGFEPYEEQRYYLV